MPYRFPPGFRRRVLDLIAAGRPIASIAVDLRVSDQTIYTWRKQELIETGVEPGSSSVEAGQLREVKRRIATRDRVGGDSAS